MYSYQLLLAAFLIFFVLQLLIETVLSVLNSRHLARQKEIPEALRAAYSQEVHEESVAYALARGRLGHVERFLSALLTLVFLFSGLINMLDFGISLLGFEELTHDVAVLLAFIMLNALLSLPLELYATFRLEARFGFNKCTLGTFVLDKLKGLLLLLVLGVPFLYGVLALLTRAGPLWWLWAGLFVIAFQFVIMVLFPVLIAPLFNKFTPLQEGELKTQLEALARQCGFATGGVFVVDGSKRSAHSNAFFMGLGKTRRIALFDTLIQQLSIPELAATLAHEIGHYRRKHILKLFVVSAALTLAGAYLLNLLLDWPLCQAFPAGISNEPKELIIVALISGPFTFWAGPLLNLLLRRHEYEADAYAAAQMGGAGPMQSALLKIYQKNLAAPLPHPAYSAYHYSHPTLLERIKALEAGAGTLPARIPGLDPLKNFS
ncbi:MAG: M48 family metallopeptidase [Planctomycetota bacterium]